jgi:hypothetical protein
MRSYLKEEVAALFEKTKINGLGGFDALTRRNSSIHKL